MKEGQAALEVLRISHDESFNLSALAEAAKNWLKLQHDTGSR
jgi:hypothetical protein